MSTQGDRLRELRLSKEKTQREIADFLKMTPKMVSFYENDERFPPHDVLIKLANYFEVSTDYLLGLTDDPTPQKLQSILMEEKSTYGKLSDSQKKVITRMDDLPPEFQEKILGMIEMLIDFDSKENKTK